jgi:hypothetical protein
MIRARRQLVLKGTPTPEKQKARQWRAVLSGTKPGNSISEQDELPKNQSVRQAENVFSANGLICAGFRPLRAGFSEPERSRHVQSPDQQPRESL